MSAFISYSMSVCEIYSMLLLLFYLFFLSRIMIMRLLLLVAIVSNYTNDKCVIDVGPYKYKIIQNS